MVTTVTERLLTAEEFACLPEAEDGGRMELVEGRVVMAPPPGAQHGKRSIRVTAYLLAFVEQHRLGEVLPEVGFRLRQEPDAVRAPDSAFLAAARIPASGLPSCYIEGAPDLAVEVMSPNDRERDVLTKVGEYLDAGAGRVWVVRAATRTVSVYSAGGDVFTLHSDDTLTSEHAGFSVEGFALPLAELFA
jgi:Uma2 family endonuclease